MPIPFMEMGEGFASGEDVMARSQEPLNGSDHSAQNGVKARRAAIVLFIVATFGIMAVLSFPLTRNIRLPLPRPLQSALSPAERLIRPIVPWLGPLTGFSSAPRPGQVIAGRPISQPPPPQRGSFPPQPGPPSEEPPPPSPGGDDAWKDRSTLPPAPGTAAGTVVKAPPPPRPGSGTAFGTSGHSAAARGQSGEQAAKPGKHAKAGKDVKNKKHAKHRKRGKHAKKAKNGTTGAQANGRKKG